MPTYNEIKSHLMNRLLTEQAVSDIFEAGQTANEIIAKAKQGELVQTYYKGNKEFTVSFHKI
jgi:hypothetical protein